MKQRLKYILLNISLRILSVSDKIDEITKNRIETLILELMDLKVLEDAVSLKLKVKALRDAVTEAGASFY